jgi:hypothetical protein
VCEDLQQCKRPCLLHRDLAASSAAPSLVSASKTSWTFSESSTLSSSLSSSPASVFETTSADARSSTASLGTPALQFDDSQHGLPLVLTAGSLVVFSSKLQHRSSVNLSADPRRVYYAQYSKHVIGIPRTGKGALQSSSPSPSCSIAQHATVNGIASTSSSDGAPIAEFPCQSIHPGGERVDTSHVNPLCYAIPCGTGTYSHRSRRAGPLSDDRCPI